MRNNIVSVVDHTSSWGNRRRDDVFPAVYRQNPAPSDAQDCRNRIRAVREEAGEAREERERLLADGSQDGCEKWIKTLRTRINKLAAVNRAYMHGLVREEGVTPPDPIQGTQLSLEAKVNEVARSLKDLVAVMQDDFADEVSESKLRERLRTIAQRLDTVFV